MTTFTVAQLKEALPPHLKSSATQELADKVNRYNADPDFARDLRDNLVSYTRVLLDGKFKVEDYISAVTYVSMKLMGFSNQEAYSRTFPDRYTALVARGADDKEISAYVAAYNKGKLVNLILEQTLVPVWVLNQDIYQKAINVQSRIMLDPDVSAKVRVEAANSILTHLKRPEKTQVELSLGEGASAGLTELKDTLTALAHQQQAMISQGLTTKDMAHQKLIRGETIEGTVKDVTPQ